MTGKIIPFKRVRYHWSLYLFVVPTVLLIALFQYYPAASGIYHSFFRWNGQDISEFIGLTNFTDLMKNLDFWRSFKVALTLGFFNVVKMIPALIAAVCINRCRSERAQYIYRIFFIIPMVIPGLVAALIWRSFFFEATNGYLNRFLVSTHLLDVLAWLDLKLGWGGIFTRDVLPVWLGDPRQILTACIIWGFPWIASFAVLTHLARLQAISKDLYEAADLDGVNWWSKFWHIELPLLSGSIYLLLVFVVIDTLKDAGMILALAGIEGGPGGVVTVPALFMMRKAFIEQNLGAACAVGVVLTLVVMTLQKIIGAAPELKTKAPRTAWLIKIAILVFVWSMALAIRTGPATAYVLGAGSVWFLFGDFLRKGYERLVAPWIEKCRLIVRRAPGLPGRDSRFKESMLRFSKHAFLWVLLAFALLPLLLMALVSFKSNQQFYLAPTTLTLPLHCENWTRAWHQVSPALANSLFISITATAASLGFGLCGAYFFARYRLPLSGALWNLMLILLMMPSIANLIPLFRLLSTMNLTNSLAGLIIVGISSGQVFAIFVLRGFIEDIPHDLFEAAEIDGASHLQQMRNVVIPLSGPILGTIAVTTFIGQWNEFILPLVLIRDADRLPIMVKLLYLAGEYLIEWGALMAGYTLASVPLILLFVFSMKLFIRGLSEGAVKG